MAYKTTIIGIDCSAKSDKKEVGLALAESSSTGCVLQCVSVLSANKANSSIPKFLANQIKDDLNPVLLALDAPLGWPDGMRGGLADHSAGAPLFIEQDCTFRHRKEQFVKNFVKRQKKHPGKGDIERNYIFRRLTDQFVKEKARKNTILEVGADKIARTTHWALSLLEELRTSRRKIPLAWRQGQISGVKAIEVYPATVLPVLSLDVNTSYKTGESAPANRGDILNKLKKRIRFVPQIDEKTILADDNMLDAVLCVQAGQEFLSKNCINPPKENTEIAHREGWIWFSKKAIKNPVE